jgi:hypothetical protein
MARLLRAAMRAELSQVSDGEDVDGSDYYIGVGMVV